MDFQDQIKQFSARAKQVQSNISTEEATKMSLIVPFFQILGYDVFNPSEFCPEFTADVGIKKGEKVDYAIMDENFSPLILIECKSCNDTLDRHGSQLFRYFSTTPAKFGILTNGIIYRFYTDLEEANKMDLTPFLEINILDLKDSYIAELKKFCKSNFDSDNIFSTASELKYTGLIKGVLTSEFDNPSDDFIRFLLTNIYDGPKTQKVIEKFYPVVKKSFTSFINEIVNQKISSALNENNEDNSKIDAMTSDTNVEDAIDDTEIPKSKIITTQDEIESFYIVRGILAGTVDVNDIAYRDTESYFGILYKNNNRKAICRLNFDTKRSQILIPDENKNFVRYYLESMNDIYLYKDQLIEVTKRYMEQ